MGGDNVDLKVVLLGREFSGKTALAYRYLCKEYRDKLGYQATIGAAFGARRFDVENKVVTMGLWDTAGSERYESMSRVYYQGAFAALVCFELVEIESWLRARYWVNEVQNNAPECRIYLIGTKVDLIRNEEQRRRVNVSDAQSFADDIGAKFTETSSKTGENVEEMFYMIASDYAKMATSKDSTMPHPKRETLQLSEDKKRSSCC